MQRIIGKLDKFLDVDFVADDVANYELPTKVRNKTSYVPQSSNARYTVNEDNAIIDGLHYNY